MKVIDRVVRKLAGKEKKSKEVYLAELKKISQDGKIPVQYSIEEHDERGDKRIKIKSSDLDKMLELIKEDERTFKQCENTRETLDKYIFSSVYPNEAMRKKVKTILQESVTS